jgi:hypothetical protein
LIAGFGTVGYFIATRRAKRPFVGFIIRYAVAFLSLILLEAGFLWLLPSVHTGMRHLTTVVVGWMVGLAGAGNSVSGSTLTLQDPAIAFEIDVACLGGILFWAYIALVLAEPTATRRQRLIRLGGRRCGPRSLQLVQNHRQHLCRMVNRRQYPRLLLPLQYALCHLRLGGVAEDYQAKATGSNPEGRLAFTERCLAPTTIDTTAGSPPY